MSVHEEIAAIEAGMDRDDPTSVVHGVDRLIAVAEAAAEIEAVPVLAALCPWLDLLDRDAELAAVAERIIASPHAAGLQPLWGAHWRALAVWRLDDLDPMPGFLAILDALGDDLSPEATALGNRLWGPAAVGWTPERFLPAYEPWAGRRFATAAELDRRVIVHRVAQQVAELGDEPAELSWLTRVLAWPGIDERPWGSPLRSRLAAVRLARGELSEARAEYLRLAAEASGAPAIGARMLAARAAARAGDTATAIHELGELARQPSDDRESRTAAAAARLARVELMVEHAPADGDREALAMWRELGGGGDDELARLAGLALARSWAQLEAAVVVERSTDILIRFPEPGDADVATLVVMALNSRTRASAELGDADAALADAERALALADDGVPDFVRATTARNREALLLRRGDYTERDEIYGVVRRMLDEANAASERGDREASARTFRRVFEMTQPSADPATRLVGLAALQDWTVDLLADRDDAQAADVARRSIEAAVVDDGPGTEMLAQAWLQLGVAANRLADRATARHAFAQVASVVDGSTVHALAELDSRAAWNLAVLLDDGSAPEEAVRSYARVVATGSADPAPAKRRRVAKALKNSAVVLRDELGRHAESGAAWAEIVARFDGDPDPELARLVAEARQHAPRPPRKGLFRRRS